jgi:hypothetical protein
MKPAELLEEVAIAITFRARRSLATGRFIALDSFIATVWIYSSFVAPSIVGLGPSWLGGKEEHFGAFYMAATYWNHGEPYRESLHSAQSASVYSTDSASSPLDSIIRDYPLVPGASPNAFQFSPNSYGPSQRIPVPSVTRHQQYQQQQPGTPTRLRQLQSPPGESGQFPLLVVILFT